jgi:hypothetical protein
MGDAGESEEVYISELQLLADFFLKRTTGDTPVYSA